MRCSAPINITTAPDGSLYIADMYHGIIQEGNWTRPGSWSPAQDRPVSARQDHRSRPHLAAPLRRRAHDSCDARRSRRASHARDPGAGAGAAARSRPAADARRNTGAARRASQPRKRLVAQYRPATAGVAGRTNPSFPGCRIWSGRRATCWHASTRSGRSKGLARSTQRSCVSN